MPFVVLPLAPSLALYLPTAGLPVDRIAFGLAAALIAAGLSARFARKDGKSRGRRANPRGGARGRRLEFYKVRAGRFWATAVRVRNRSRSDGFSSGEGGFG